LEVVVPKENSQNQAMSYFEKKALEEKKKKQGE